MFMVDTGLIIKSDREGQPALFFKTDAREILPPQTHAERMEWVRSSFSRFYTQIEENDYAYQVKTAAALTRF
jgi:tyrosine-protein phosphatase YwqE